MSFFEQAASNAHEPPEPELRRATPAWFEAPLGVVPGQSMQHAVVFATDRAILAIRQLDVYPAGVEFSLDLQVRPPAERLFETPWELQPRSSVRRTPFEELPDEFLRLGFEFADGTTWSNLVHDFPGFDEAPDRPVVIGRGGGGGGDRWSMRYWMWPLPPAGDVVVHAAWPLFDIGEVSAVLDGTELRRQAEAAQQIWK